MQSDLNEGGLVLHVIVSQSVSDSAGWFEMNFVLSW